jgi:hypothetical protein
MLIIILSKSKTEENKLGSSQQKAMHEDRYSLRPDNHIELDGYAEQGCRHESEEDGMWKLKINESADERRRANDAL